LRTRLLAALIVSLLVMSAGAASAVEPDPTRGADDADLLVTANERGRPGATPGAQFRRAVTARAAASTLVVSPSVDRGTLRRHPLVDRLEHDPDLDRWVVTTSSPDRLARDLQRQRHEAEPVVVVHASADALAAPPAAPSDPFYRHHWGAQTTQLPYALAATRWPTRAPVVAVLDTGVAPHPELGDRLLAGVDLVTPGGDGRVDPNGHGTNTALTVAAAADDGRGSVGSCPRCRILPIRVLDAKGSGSSTAIAQAIRHAVDLGADVINISAGGVRSGGSFSYEDSAVAYAAAAGVPILASAGNDGSTTPQYPAAMEGIIAVAGHAESGGRASGSNYGAWVDIAAPWCSVVGTPTGASNYCGTSSATPFASGLVGLRRATVGAEPVETVRQQLRSATHPVSWVASGRLDPCAVVRSDAATATPRSSLQWTAGAAPTSLTFDLATRVVWTRSGSRPPASPPHDGSTVRSGA
jgi:hypothetical protein